MAKRMTNAGGALKALPSESNGLNINSENDPSALLNKISMLEKDLERRQESYVTRERAYKSRIDELEEELTLQRQEKTGWMKSDVKMNKLKQLQGTHTHTLLLSTSCYLYLSISGQIINNVTLVQDRTAKILQEQERDLLRAFRARLFDVQTELEKEKSKKDDGAGAWIEKSRQLEAEVEWAKEVHLLIYSLFIILITIPLTHLFIRSRINWSVLIKHFYKKIIV